MHARIEEGLIVEYPIVDLRERLPDISLPVDLTLDSALPLGFVYVHATATPSFDPATHKLVATAPKQVKGRWEVGYETAPLDDRELAAIREQKAVEVRAERNRRMAECDWTQAADAPVDKTAWAAYRQALRDITKQPGYPFDVQWPEEPAQEAPTKTAAETLQEEIVNAVQQRLDSFAKTRGYSNILSACTYATSAVPKFKTEGQHCVDLRDATWAKLYEMLGEVQTGARPIPSSFADIESELPALDWPI